MVEDGCKQCRCVCVSLCAMRGRARERGSLGSVCCTVHHCSSTPAPDLCPYRGPGCLPPCLSAPLSLLFSRECADDALFHYSRRRETSCRFSKNPQGTSHPDYLKSESLPACWFAFLSFFCLNSSVYNSNTSLVSIDCAGCGLLALCWTTFSFCTVSDPIYLTVVYVNTPVLTGGCSAILKSE